LFVGADQERPICVEDVDVVARPVGGPGTPDDEDDVGVTAASFDAVLAPAEFIAETLYVYVVPVVSPVCRYIVEVLAVFDTNVAYEPEPDFTSIL
jgi:hypothetical protein